mmetsp:Transcript_36796/g.103812  ORF Transcript_36796/g.103812 Transcript_36796/m.103812 type:complete len:336 (+) Transcript_36796:161-1168(+)
MSAYRAATQAFHPHQQGCRPSLRGRHLTVSLAKASPTEAATCGERKPPRRQNLADWVTGTLRSNQANGKVATDRAVMKPARSEKDFQAQSYPWWWVLPLQPYGIRKTVREEVVTERVWSFEQPHGAINIVINIRMTVVRLQAGGLWVHAPIAPTKECIELLRELEERYGEVKFIVHPTYALEHKVHLGPFSRACPSAEIWVAPGQWSYPLNLPISLLGVFPRKVQIIGEHTAPWSDEFDSAILSLPLKGVGSFVEVSFHHKDTCTLLLTDLLICPTKDPPGVCRDDPSPLLLMQRDNPTSELRLDYGGEQAGWKKTVLLALYLRRVNLLRSPAQL